MDKLAAVAFSVGTLAGGFVYGLVYARHNNGDWGELGLVVAFIGGSRHSTRTLVS